MKTFLNRLRSSTLAVLVGLLVVAPACFITSCISGCSSANRISYIGAGASRISVETAMRGFNVWVKDQKAKGKDTTKEETQARALFEKWKASQVELAESGRLNAVYLSTNTTGGTGVSAVFEDLTGNAAQYKTDLLNFLRSLGLSF